MPDHPRRALPDAGPYRYLEAADAAGIAWEWLRRNPGYRALEPSRRWWTAEGLTVVEAASAASKARWGCLNIEAPHLQCVDAPILWSASVDPSVLCAAARPAASIDPWGFDLRFWAREATLVLGGDREHLQIGAGVHRLRLDVMAGSLLSGPVRLRYEIVPARNMEAVVATLRRFLHLCRTGDLLSAPTLTPQRLRRQIEALRVHDALAAGASIRDIGLLLFGHDRVRAEWHGASDALKSRCRRLVALARFMASGGYKNLPR